MFWTTRCRGTGVTGTRATRTASRPLTRRPPSRSSGEHRPAPGPPRPAGRAGPGAPAPVQRGYLRPLVGGDRPVHGDGAVHRLDDDRDRGMVRVAHPRAERTALRPVHLHIPDFDLVLAGVLRRAADPARAEPAGRP